ncbi:uncharacterized protein C8orf48 homolog [Pelodytes ibericus]
MDHSEDQASSDYKESSSQNSLSNSGSGYSSDSFESFIDGSNIISESGTFESFSSGAESDEIPSSTTATSSSEILEDTLETPSQGKEFIEKLIKTVQGHELKLKTYPLGCRRTNVAVAVEKHIAHKEVSKEERNTLELYCTKKIRHMQHAPVTTKQSQLHATPHKMPAVGTPEFLVPIQLLNRLRLKNTKETMKQVIKTEMHQPSSCPDCFTKQAELAKSDFLRKRTTKLETRLLEKRIEDTYHKDIVTFIGEIHQGLPRLSDESDTIWQRLLTTRKMT